MRRQRFEVDASPPWHFSQPTLFRPCGEVLQFSR